MLFRKLSWAAALLAGVAGAQDFVVTGSYTHPADTTYFPLAGTPHWHLFTPASLYHSNTGLAANSTPDGADRGIHAFTLGSKKYVYTVRNVSEVILWEVVGPNWVKLASVPCPLGCYSITASQDGRTVWSLGGNGGANSYNNQYTSKLVHRLDFTWAFTNTGPAPSLTETVDIKATVTGVEHCRNTIGVSSDDQRVYIKCVTPKGPGSKWLIIGLTSMNLAGPKGVLPLPEPDGFLISTYNNAPIRLSPFPGSNFLLMHRYAAVAGNPNHLLILNTSAVTASFIGINPIPFKPASIAIAKPNLAYVSQGGTANVVPVGIPTLTPSTPLALTPSAGGAGGCANHGTALNYDIDVSRVTGDVFGLTYQNGAPYRGLIRQYTGGTVKCHWDPGTPGGLWGGGRWIMVGNPGKPPVTGGTVTVTFSTNLPNMPYTVDNNNIAGANSYTWTPGSTHNVKISNQNGPFVKQFGSNTVEYIFQGWNGAGCPLSNNANMTTPNVNTNCVAQFKRRFRLTVVNTSAATTTPATGFYDEGTVVPIAATPPSGHVFNFWDGSMTQGKPTPFTGNSIVMNQPHWILPKAGPATGVSLRCWVLSKNVTPPNGTLVARCKNYGNAPMVNTTVNTVGANSTPAGSTATATGNFGTIAPGGTVDVTLNVTNLPSAYDWVMASVLLKHGTITSHGDGLYWALP